MALATLLIHLRPYSPRPRKDTMQESDLRRLGCVALGARDVRTGRADACRASCTRCWNSARLLTGGTAPGMSFGGDQAYGGASASTCNIQYYTRDWPRQQSRRPQRTPPRPVAGTI
eukprot:scaffold2542_cov325-Prasinococcus_capsulatus_cf.AAC.3